MGTFNLDRAREAAAAEADNRPWPFEFCGHTYVMLPAKQWPLKVSEYLADGRVDLAMRLLITETGYRQLVEDGAVMGDLELIMEAYSEDAGVDSLPNSDAPPSPDSIRT